jgi:hypothetical protein
MNRLKEIKKFFCARLNLFHVLLQGPNRRVAE